MSTTTDPDPVRRRQMELRSARDQLVDLLGFGLTLPLQDLVVHDESLTVPVGDVAIAPIDPGQTDVQYELRDPNGAIVGASLDGTGGATDLVTPAIIADITFDVVATKKLDVGRTAVLHESASVKVGLDRLLATRIVADPLDSALDAPADDHPRIVDWGSRVQVTIVDAQEGVDYKLLDLTGVSLVDGQGNEVTDPTGLGTTISEQDVVGLGTGQSTDLYIAAVQEDILVGVAGIKTFDPATEIPDMVTLLDLKLPLKVRADSALAATIDPIVDHGADATVTLVATQASASYQLYARPLDDREFIYGVTAADVLGLAVPGEEDARIPAPDWWTLHWPVAPPAGFTAVGGAQPGTGGDVPVVFSTVDEDHLVIVQAKKEHAVDLDDAAAGTIASHIQLQPFLLLLVRPQTAPPVGGATHFGKGGLRFGEIAFVRSDDGAERKIEEGAVGDDEEAYRVPARFAIDFKVSGCAAASSRRRIAKTSSPISRAPWKSPFAFRVTARFAIVVKVSGCTAPSSRRRIAKTSSSISRACA